ncbi:hypothetical protein Dda_4724 [Drechslerella dactyloides]|uniref:TFIIIC transcription initiation factor complex subunits Tfc3 n=1 Tax=Drechslerella dactyloides TaxID=74499 RepID=A0AAD6NKV8_DREDA|nr:hypothetical protein Dda_4724 [Drechslerella dactyloides]
MADLNELLDIIKDECALTVNQGLPVASIWNLITDFLSNDKTAVVPLETLDPTVPTPSAAYYPDLPLDSSLRDDIWERIKKDPDISIGLGNEGKDLSFDDAEAGLHAEDQPNEDGKPSEWRLYASERLQWRRIAGHDIDTVRLFPTLWQLLKIIAVNREDGILQPHLTAQSGQDARSVGPRTKDLAGKGYIMKIPVIAMKVGTSKLILKRFYKGAMEKKKTQKKKRLATIKEHAKSGKKLPKEFLEEPLDIEEVIAGIFKLLKSAKNKVLLIEDLKFRLNCTSTRSRRKACRRIMDRLESMGCIQKIRAMGSENEHAQEFEMGPVDEEKITDLKGVRFAKCVKFIRDLKPLEWHEAVKGARPSADDRELDALDEFDSDDEQDDGYRVIRSAPTVRVIDGRRVIVPLWRRTHLMHTIYDQVFAAGVEGIRSGMLSGAVFGPFYYRPFDQIMGRWTTKSLQNQPDHLKSTSIVRETDLYKRTANYRYWTTESFQAMLDEKQIDYEAAAAAADAYKISKRPKKKSKNVETVDKDEPAVLDENGFMTVNTAAFVRGDGRGSFQDCQNAAPKKGSGLRPKGVSPLKGRKRKVEPGGERPAVKLGRPRKKPLVINEEQQDGEAPVAESPMEETVVVIGRKRKYPPGTEPYLKEKPRVEAVKKAVRLGSIKEVASDGTALDCATLPEGFQPLSTIDEASWTIEMIAERTFMDLVENKPYQVPLTTARYRQTGNGKKGRPRKTEQAPEPEQIVLGPIFQPGPDGLVEITPAPPPSSNSKKAAKAPKRPTKRRKTEHLSAAEGTTAPESAAVVEQSLPMEVDGPVPAEAQPAANLESKGATEGTKKQDAIVVAESGDSKILGSSKRKSRGKDATPKGRPLKKNKETHNEPRKVVGEVTITDRMDVDAPCNPAQGEKAPLTSTETAMGAIHVKAVLDTSSIAEQSTKRHTEEATLPETASEKISKSSSHPLPEAIDVIVTTPKPAEDKGAREIQPTNGVQMETLTTKTTNTESENADTANGKPGVIVTPALPPPPKLEPFTDAKGIRLELVYAEVRKNRGIGGVLRANRRRLLLGMLAEADGAVSINAGYRKFVQYIKDRKEQTSTIDRKTFNGIIDDANVDGKIFVIGVFKGSRRIGTILSVPDLNFKTEQIETAKRVIVEELDKPFAWKLNVSRGIAAKSANIPIERIDFERYSRASKIPPLGEKSSARRRMDAEKMSTLARLQAITENEKQEGTAARKAGKGKARAEPITSRTRSKMAAMQLLNENGESIERSLSEESIDPDIPEDSLHRWQLTPVDPNIYPVGTTNFPPYTVPETGTLGYVPYGNYEDYAAVSAVRNQAEAGYGILGPENYESLRPRRRQQAGGRAGLRKATTVLEGDVDPSLEPTKRRGRPPKPKVPKPKVPTQSKPPREKKPPKRKSHNDNDDKLTTDHVTAARAPPRPKDAPRLRTTLEEDVTLTLAIIIIRTLFGGYVRSIKWDLVASALPQYDRYSIQAHWPRVRVKMKDEIPQYQAEFEEQYLRAFYQGKVPLFDKNRGCDFDLRWHLNWLRPLVKNIRPVTERRILPDDRQQLESLYDIVVTPLDWRRDFFNYMTTMSWKEHQLRNHSSAIVKVEEADELLVPGKRRAIDRAKHAWRSIFVTEDERYDEEKARELMKVHSHQASSAALTELHKVDKFIVRSRKGGRFGTASAQARVLQPWKTAFPADIFPEARDFQDVLVKSLEGGGEFKVVSTGLKPGYMAWIIDQLVRGEIDIYTKNFKESNRGLAESLVTRAINPVLFHFDIFISASGASSISQPALDPVGLHDAVPLGSMTDMALPPFMWQNMHEEVIGYLWERVVRSVLAVVVGRPGATVDIIVKTLNGVLNARDAVAVIRWLLHRGGLEEKSEGRYWGGREYLACGV